MVFDFACNPVVKRCLSSEQYPLDQDFVLKLNIHNKGGHCSKKKKKIVALYNIWAKFSKKVTVEAFGSAHASVVPLEKDITNLVW